MPGGMGLNCQQVYLDQMLYQMFKNATAGISVSSRPTIPYVLPVYQMMQVKLEEWEGDMKLPPAIRLASAQAHRKLQKFKSMADKNECFIIGNSKSSIMQCFDPN